MLFISETTRFRRDLRLILRRGKDIQKLKILVQALAQEESLPPCNRDHILSGNWYGHRECHIEPDWLLIYKIADGFLFLERTGSHTDLFD